MSGERSSAEELRARLEQRANMARSKLLRTLAALDGRRPRGSAQGSLARRIATPVGASLAGLTVVTLCAAAAVRAFVLHRHRRSLAYRLGERLAPFRSAILKEPPAPFAQVAGRNLALRLVGAGAAELARRIVREIVSKPRGPVVVSASPELPRLGVAVVDMPSSRGRRALAVRHGRR